MHRVIVSGLFALGAVIVGARASADVVVPGAAGGPCTPPTCATGSVLELAHHGECPEDCELYEACTPSGSCAYGTCTPTRLCVEDRRIAPIAPARFLAFGPCDPSGACATGTCVELDRCVMPPRTSTPAPAASHGMCNARPGRAGGLVPFAVVGLLLASRTAARSSERQRTRAMPMSVRR